MPQNSNKGTYSHAWQVVLLGCGMDTRPFRLGWPPGTLLFLLAPSEVHDAAKQTLKAAGATAPRGCLLRRVPIDLEVRVLCSTCVIHAAFCGRGDVADQTLSCLKTRMHKFREHVRLSAGPMRWTESSNS